jgi:tetratricopeptide (TPR) repeat protein
MRVRTIRFAWLLLCSSMMVLCAFPKAWSEDAASAVRAILATRIDARIGLAPVRVAAEKASFAVVRSDPGELVIQFTGSGNYGYIRSSGGILIAGTHDIRTLDDVDLLSADLGRAVSLLEQVSPSIPAKMKYDCLYLNPVYYLPDPRVFQQLLFPPGTFDGRLIVPDCQMKHARIVGLPTPQYPGRPGGDPRPSNRPRSAVRFREKQLRSYNAYPEGERYTCDITDQLVFGVHQLKIEGEATVVALQVLTAPTTEVLQFAGSGGERVVATRVLPVSTAVSETREPAAPGAPSESQRSPAQPRVEGPAISRTALRDVAKALDETVKKLDAGVMPSPDDAQLKANLAQPLLWLGEYNVRRNQPEAALPLLERCVRLAPDEALAHAALARAHKAQGDSAKFAAEIARAVAIDPKVPVDEPPAPADAVTLPVGDVQAAAKRIEAAEGEGRTNELCAAVRAVDALAHCGLGVALLTENSASAALDEFRKATAAAPDCAAGHRGCAEAAWMARDEETAVSEIQMAYRLDPREEVTLAALSGMQTALGRDLTPPAVWFIEPADGDTVRDATVPVRFAAEDPAGIAKVTLYADGKKVDDFFPRLGFQGKVSLRRGDHTLRLEAKDKAGNVSVAEIRIKR